MILNLCWVLTATHMAFGSKSEFDMQGHRGARGLFPENTLRAFEAAVENGMSTIELDLHFTKDEAFIVFHDINCFELRNG